MTQTAKQQAPLLAAYLVVGEDALKRQAVIKRLRTRLAQAGDLEFNHDVFDGETCAGADVVSACDTLPFMSDVRLVEVSAVEKLKKADSEALVAYLANPSETTVLVLLSEKLAKNTRLYKAVAAVGKQAVIDCAPKARRELPKLVRDMAVGHGVVFSDKAARTLLDLVGEDTVALDAEIRKVALAHSGKDPVSDKEVSALVAPTAEPKPWEFVDAVSARDLPRALALLGRMTSVTPYSLLPQCSRRMRELLCAKALAERGGGPADLAKALKMPDWRVRNHLTWARSFSRQELHRALRLARDAERAMKSGAVPQDAFMAWLLQVIPR
ncbi:MAG: DNA polymerase III subunit delta [Coriobacteriia bacterium]|nr:DNA polymerase III subunit delta [Coriobacteriia bacterium]